MSKISLMRDGICLASREGKDETQLPLDVEYQEGDELRFQSDSPYAVVGVDAAVAPARVYLPKGGFTYRLPLGGDRLDAYAPGAFAGRRHLAFIQPDTVGDYRNLALNPADQRGDTDAYPHVTANVETRGESQFFARNVLDGLRIANGHGCWPYQSWGVGTRTDARITLRFGRAVRVDEMALYLRADFPHDAYWTEGTATLSDGYELRFPLRKLDGAQRVPLGEHTVEWIQLDRLVKCEEGSPFPALRQWEVYGRDL